MGETMTDTIDLMIEFREGVGKQDALSFARDAEFDVAYIESYKTPRVQAMLATTTRTPDEIIASLTGNPLIAAYHSKLLGGTFSAKDAFKPYQR